MNQKSYSPTTCLTGTPLKERVTGVDLVQAVAKLAAKNNFSLFLLGGKKESAQKAAEKLKLSFEKLKIAGVLSPFVFSDGEQLESMIEDDKPIIDQINQSEVDILLIGFGNPKQELWFNRNRSAIKVPVIIGVGGTFEFISGKTARAPLWVQKSGLEWIFRISQDPKRLWKRYIIDFFKFGLLILPSILDYRYQKIRFMLLNRSDRNHSFEESFLTEARSNTIELLHLGSILDAQQIHRLKNKINTLIKKADVIVLDMGKLSFINSAGIGFLLFIWRKIEGTKKKWRITGVKEPVKRTLKLMRVWGIFEDFMHNDLEDALIDLCKYSQSNRLNCFLLDREKYYLFFIVGSLDLAGIETSGKLDLLLNALSNNQKDCILSVRGLDFMDSSGLAVILKLLRKLSQSGNRLILTQVQPQVKQVLKISKIEKLFKISKNIADAEKILGLKST